MWDRHFTGPYRVVQQCHRYTTLGNDRPGLNHSGFMWTSDACAITIQRNPCQELSRHKANTRVREPDRPRWATGRETLGERNIPLLRSGIDTSPGLTMWCSNVDQ